MVNLFHIQALTVFIFVASAMLVAMHLKMRGGSRGFLYGLYAMLAYWLGNIVSYLFFLAGLDFFGVARLFILNFSIIFMLMAFVVLGRDFNALSPGVNIMRTSMFLMAEVLVLFSLLTGIFMAGGLSLAHFHVITRLNEMIILLVALYYLVRMLSKTEYQLHWLLFTVAVLGFGFGIITDIMMGLTGIDLVPYQNVGLAIIIIGLLGGLALLARRLKVF